MGLVDIRKEFLSLDQAAEEAIQIYGLDNDEFFCLLPRNRDGFISFNTDNKDKLVRDKYGFRSECRIFTRKKREILVYIPASCKFQFYWVEKTKSAYFRYVDDFFNSSTDEIPQYVESFRAAGWVNVGRELAVLTA